LGLEEIIKESRGQYPIFQKLVNTRSFAKAEKEGGQREENVNQKRRVIRELRQCAIE